jgi:hypothetical protein
LKKWITEEREKETRVSTISIRLKAKEMAEQKSISDFKGSNNWCFKFTRRNRLSVRAVTSVGQSLPSDWEEKMATFKLFVDNIKTGINFQHIGNMDEVPISFDMAGNYTVEKIGTQDIKITTTGHEKCFFTVVLCVTADGRKCDPLAIFKRKTIPKEKFPKGVVVKINSKGWMNQEMFSEWLDEVWRRRKNSFFNTKSLLIYDSARAHITEDVKNLVKRYSQIAVIPGGLTKKLQPLDLTVNKSFKSKLRNKWEKWMIEGYHTFTKNGNIRRATCSRVCNWIKESWDEISIECIKNGFRKAGICDYMTADNSERNPYDESTDEESSQEEDEEIPDELIQILETFETDCDEDFDGF